jgi:hypothetical protein
VTLERGALAFGTWVSAGSAALTGVLWWRTYSLPCCGWDSVIYTNPLTPVCIEVGWSEHLWADMLGVHLTCLLFALGFATVWRRAARGRTADAREPGVT